MMHASTTFRAQTTDTSAEIALNWIRSSVSARKGWLIVASNYGRYSVETIDILIEFILFSESIENNGFP